MITFNSSITMTEQEKSMLFMALRQGHKESSLKQLAGQFRTAGRGFMEALLGTGPKPDCVELELAGLSKITHTEEELAREMYRGVVMTLSMAQRACEVDRNSPTKADHR